MVAGKDHAAFAHGDVMRRVEAASGDMAERADVLGFPPPQPSPDVRGGISGAECIAAIFDDPQVVLAGYRHDRIQIERIAQRVRHHDGAGALGHGSFDLLRVDVIGGDVHIDEHRHHAVLQHGVHGGWKTSCYRDDFIARLQRALTQLVRGQRDKRQ